MGSVAIFAATIARWLSRIDKDTKAARDKRIFDLWLACHTQDEIAESVGCDRHDVDNLLRKSAELPEYAKPAASHLTDFDPPLYNVWKQQEKTQLALFVQKNGQSART